MIHSGLRKISHKSRTLTTTALLFAYAFGSSNAHAQISTGQIRPKFLVLSVTYLPPCTTGGNSTIDYALGASTSTASTALGTSSDLTPGLAAGNPPGIAIASGTNTIATSLAQNPNAAFLQSANSGTSIAVHKTPLWGFTTYPICNGTTGVDHDNDLVLIWLNPILNFQINEATNALTWTGYSFDSRDPLNTMDYTDIRISQLKDPSTMSAGLVASLARAWDSNRGLTTADYAAIMSADPFASGSLLVDPKRFDLANSSPLDFITGQTVNGPATYSQISSLGLTSSHSYKVDLAYSAQTTKGLGILQGAFPQNFTWTDVSDQHSASNVGQQVGYTITGPGSSYTGPSQYRLYRDNIYGTFAFAPIVPNHFVPITPCRVADTRNLSGAFGGPILAAGQARDFTLPASSCGIPGNASAYSLNFTVVPTTGPLGYLTVWPAGQPQPLTSVVNSDGKIKASAAIVPAGASGGVSVYASNQTHLVIDVNGYFVAAGAAPVSELSFFPISPCRVLDTRSNSSPIATGTSRAVPVVSSGCGIPNTAQAYALNFTAVPRQPLGYLSTWPTGQSQPLVSTLNAPDAAVTANAAIVPAGSNGNISVYAANDTDLVIDANGYFAPAATGALSLYNVQPCRVLDTRLINNATPLNGDTTLTPPSSPCLPGTLNPQAFVLNATVVTTGALGYLSLWPSGASWPGVSTLNTPNATVASNLAIVPATNGSIAIRSTNPTQVIVDVSGYFAP